MFLCEHLWDPPCTNFAIFQLCHRHFQLDSLKFGEFVDQLRKGCVLWKYISYFKGLILFTEGALSIEVWGHRCAGFTKSKEGWEVEQQQLAKARSLADR